MTAKVTIPSRPPPPPPKKNKNKKNIYIYITNLYDIHFPENHHKMEILEK